MKKLSLLLLPLLLLAASCANSNDATDDAVSTPIDSTNTQGTAPVQYGADQDTGTTLPDAHAEEGHKANTPGGDSVPSAGNRK